MRLKLYLIFMFLLVFVMSSVAQDDFPASSNKRAQKYFEKASAYYQDQQMENAHKALQKSMEADSNFIGAWLLKGDIMQENKQFDLALNAYEKAIAMDSNAFPGLYFTMGKLAYRVAKYGLSSACFQEYTERVSLDSAGYLLVKQAQLQSDVALELENNPWQIEFKNGGELLNTDADEYVNFVTVSEDKMVITRKIKREIHLAKKPVFDERFLISAYVDSAWIQPELMDIPWMADQNVGGMTMSADGRSMLFTGCYWPKGQGSCDLYFSNRVGNEWMDPQSFNRQINTSGWESQPVITADGKTIYFSSKRPGGKGGADIWKTVYLSGKGWSPPVNLGDSINTSADEMAPFIHGDGQTLYFSSNGHPCLGGYDLFMARKSITGQWGQVTNLGVPINSPADDINIFVGLKGKQGWISSDRAGTMGGMDIWQFDIPLSLAPQKVLLLGGVVSDSLSRLPLKAQIEVVELPLGIEKRQLYSDSVTGEFLVVLQSKKSYLFNISKTGYLFYSKQVFLDEDSDISYLEKAYLLQPISSGLSMNLYHILFDFNSDLLLPASYIELDKLIQFLESNPLVKVDIVGHTDNRGTHDFNQKLSERRAQTVLNYLIFNGVNPERLTSKGRGDKFPIATNEDERGRAKNRRTEIIIQ